MLFEELWEKAELLDEMVKRSCESFSSYIQMGKNKNWLTTYEFAKLKELNPKLFTHFWDKQSITEHEKMKRGLGNT